MGKVATQPNQTIQHFSHPHPLQLTNYQAHQTLNLSPCSCCKVPVSGLTYFCQPCNYFLHVKCSQYPHQIKHPFDQHHVFSLLPIPVYPEGLFSCDACGSQGNGFSYHCKPCGVDLHVMCASMPLSVTHYSHNHQLNLTFSPPYEGGMFSCDICKTNGSNHWLYRCNFCEFDAHLTCATTKPPPSLPLHHQHSLPLHQHQQQPPHVVAAGRATSLPNNYRPIDFGNQVGPPRAGSATPAVAYGQNNSLLSQVLLSAVDPMTQQVLQAFTGGDGGGGGGGGIGGQLLQTFMGSGDAGGSLDFGGGASGGLDLGGSGQN